MDRWLAGVAVGAALGVTVLVGIVTEPGGPVGWSHEVALLWLVAAAAGGRALLGFRQAPAEEEAPTEAEAPGEARRSFLRTIPLWPVVAVLAVAPYVPALSIGFLSDDFGIMSASKAAAGPLEMLGFRPYVIFYRPLSELLWWSGLQAWGEAPLGYHLLNIGLHACNSVLVYALAVRLTEKRFAALMAGALFAVHPLHVEPVVWACCQPDLLAACLSLLSLLCLEVFLASTARWKRGAALAGALAAFLLALLSKESALGLPGVAAARMLIAGREGRWRRAVGVGGAYAGLLGGYLVWRFFALGMLGGYSVRLQFWNTLFPSSPLRQFGLFLFPVHGELFHATAGPVLVGAAVVLMAGAVVWWIRGMGYVPSGRLWFYAAYLVFMSAPVWTITIGIGTNLEGSRFTYLPTVSLAWLLGDLAGGREVGWRRRGAVSAAVVVAAGALCAWYVTPWRQADALARDVLAGGQRVVAELPETEQTPVLFVQGLPDTHIGAQVFRNGYGPALTQSVARPVVVQTVAARGGTSGLTPQLLKMSVLLPGEYELTWRDATRTMDVTRAGRPAAVGVNEGSEGSGP